MLWTNILITTGMKPAALVSLEKAVLFFTPFSRAETLFLKGHPLRGGARR